MITEILGALIVLGAVLVLIMRRLLSKGKAKEKESVEVSASRLRYEIERSGDAVIGRMQIHVERLERILAEANAQKAALDERLAALAQWEKVYGARLGALPQQMEFASSAPRTATQAPPTVSPVTAAPAVSSPSAVEVAASSAAAIAPAAVSTVGAGETASSFQAALMKQMAGSPIGGAVDLQLPPEEMGTDAAANIAHGTQAAQENMRREIPVHEDAASRALSAAQMPDEMQDDETQDDEAYEYEEYEEDESEEEDEEAVMEEEADEYEEDEPADEEEPPEFSGEDLTAVQEADEADDVKIPSPDVPPSRQQEQIRAFLRQGMSAEEISQRLGLGLGAIELVRHIEKRAHEE
ncbi:hypothetical protein [Selenomonas sputigena]|uniref:Uncharacterized protein n=1 Tax=Selenomonas sputigena (strain ATCC 35185 / DSM 20758 / CCUG 44933 / VPI D19B-28) TaxID=546271 RepID=C9LSR9_SELS3|nr:hypothetical protein [Selenomonas sputigena]AEC00625.1 hypothetical protein Selsp_1669 [Selenomonas sputigena ATCC 35185]EEX78018.1 hypothetical protein SELSPUOL_00494 [Selenomonas sputigena ATCC 35185]